MKDKIVFLIIGILIGGIIATTGFLVYSKTITNNSNQPEMMQMQQNGQMQPPSNGNMEQPPEKPDGDNNQEPPTRPENSSNSTNI